MTETPHEPDKDSLREDLIRRSHDDQKLLELNIEGLNWDELISGARGVHNLNEEQRKKFHEFQQRYHGRIEELRNEGIIGPDEY